jgi:hypothetical protein
MWIWVLGWPVKPVEPAVPVEIGRMSDFIFSGKWVNGQRAQPRTCEYVESDRNTALGQKMRVLKPVLLFSGVTLYTTGRSGGGQRFFKFFA